MNFCLNCGKEVNSKRICSNCKKINAEGAKYCSFCGKALVEVTTVEPEETIPEEEKDLSIEDLEGSGSAGNAILAALSVVLLFTLVFLLVRVTEPKRSFSSTENVQVATVMEEKMGEDIAHFSLNLSATPLIFLGVRCNTFYSRVSFSCSKVLSQSS